MAFAARVPASAGRAPIPAGCIKIYINHLVNFIQREPSGQRRLGRCVENTYKTPGILTTLDHEKFATLCLEESYPLMAQLLLLFARAQKRFLPAVAVFDISKQTSKPEDAY
jgi:hypothetical protein